MKLRAIACDYDRTLTDETLQPNERAFEALKMLSGMGLKIILVSGRVLPFLLTINKERNVIDAIVAENGAVVYFSGEGGLEQNGKGQKVVFGDGSIQRAFKKASFPVEVGESIASVRAPYRDDAVALIAAAGLDAELEKNRGSFMVMPKGVNKSTGLQHVIDHYGIRNDELAAIGDGENDIALFAAAGFSAAVANAVPELKAKADYVCKNAYGEGVAEFAEVILAKNADSG